MNLRPTCHGSSPPYSSFVNLDTIVNLPFFIPIRKIHWSDVAKRLQSLCSTTFVDTCTLKALKQLNVSMIQINKNYFFEILGESVLKC